MNTEIAYLEELREDLLSAAWREARPAARRSFRRQRRLSRGKLVAAMAAFSLILAGGIGWYALRGPETFGLHSYAPLRERLAGEAPTAPMPTTAPVPDDRSAALGEKLQSGYHFDVATPGAPDTATTQNRGGTSGEQGAATSPPAADLTRIVKTAEMSVVVLPADSLSDQFQKARDIANQLGGFVTNSNIQPGKTGRLVIRVPARRFNDALDQLGQLGNLESQSIKGQDVTAQFVDLQARLSIAQTHRNVLVKLLAKAHSAEQTIRLQNFVDDAQLKVEQLQGEIRLIKDQTSKATIDLSLRKSGVALPAVGGVKHPGLGSAWTHSIAGFFGVVFAVVVGLGYLVPIAIVALIAYLIVRRLRRRTPAFVEE